MKSRSISCTYKSPNSVVKITGALILLKISLGHHYFRVEKKRIKQTREIVYVKHRRK